MSLFTQRTALSLLQYCSDLHLENGYRRFISPIKPNLVLAGDIGNPKQQSYENFLFDMSKYFDNVFLVAGNHEYHHSENMNEINEKIENICSKRTNLHFLNRKSYILYPEDRLIISGCTLWAKQPFSKRIAHTKDTMWLCNEVKNSENNYVIVTHHCPHYLCIPNKYHDKSSNYFYSDQSHILKKENILMWIHGHSHHNKDLNIYDTWIVSNQYGYFKNPNKNFK